MSPQKVDSSVDYRRIGELSREFTALWTRLQAFYLDAAVGFACVRNIVESDQKVLRNLASGSDLNSKEFQDSLTFGYERIFSEPFCTSAIHTATKGEVRKRNEPGGSNLITLGRLCIVSFYDYWNEYLRREYVIAKGKLDKYEKDEKTVRALLKKHASFDLWGDIRLLRQSVVHNRGFAISEIRKCNLIHWFKPKDSIDITPDKMTVLFRALLVFRNELDAQQYPPTYISVPRR